MGLDDLQVQAIQLTVNGHSDAEISRMIQVDRKTLWRWKTHDEDYRRVLSICRAQRFAESSDRYQYLLQGATAVLAKSLAQESEQSRLRAATAILNMAGAFKPTSKQKDDFEWNPGFHAMPVLPPKVG
jgi:hypothetical protein